ncbi:MAG: response regulator [Deltaproteobacteria bacterium]|nr:response regulator [Deltaproteobacteria bacterium]
MKEIMDWLLQMEKLAGDVYRNAAEKFSKDKEFSEFLLALASDEDTHFRLLKEAGEMFLKKSNTISSIIIDQNTKDRVVTPLQNLYKRVKAAERISKHAIMKVIVAVEFAELNNIFQYVVNTFRRDGEEIKRTAMIMDEHIDRIKKFINQHSDLVDLSSAIIRLPAVGKERILIVEHKLPLRIYMSQALENFGKTEVASNGEEALQKVSANFFNLIISAVNMPVMSGLDFFKKAAESTPNIAQNFIFCSRDVIPDVEILCKVYGTTFLKIPFGINQLHEIVQKVLVMQ